VSAPAPARLALVPADAQPPAPPPFDALARSSVAKTARSARVRRVVVGTAATGCVLLLAGALLSAATGGVSVGLMLLAGAVLLPLSGVALICFALLDRSRQATSALLTAILSLALTIALLEPAWHAGVEARAAAMQPELDALAVEIRATLAAEPAGTDAKQRADMLERRYGARLRQLGMRVTTPVEGGLLFGSTGGEFSYTLLYADGAPGPADACAKARLRFIGGRWFERDCLDRVDDW
jgi:hypothetical protein